MTDLDNRQKIDKAVGRFYEQLIQDQQIGHFFTRIIPLDLEVHLPVIVDFWETTLLGSGSYKGNPMIKHLELNKLSPIRKEHFDRWLALWESSLRAEFSGPKCEEAINRAKQIAQLMDYKISAKGGLI